MLGKPPFVSALLCLVQNGSSTKTQACSLDPLRHRQDPPCLCSSFFLREGSATFCQIDASDTAESQLLAGWAVPAVTGGCTPITLINEEISAATGWWVCQAAWQRVPDVTLSCHTNVPSPDRRWAIFLHLPSEASLSSISMEPPFHKSSSGQDFRYLHHCCNFSALTQKQNSFRWSMLNVECIHPSLISFSYFCFHIDLCYHKKVCEM